MEPSNSGEFYRSRKNLWKKYENRLGLLELQQEWMTKKTFKSQQNILLKLSGT